MKHKRNWLIIDPLTQPVPELNSLSSSDYPYQVNDPRVVRFTASSFFWFFFFFFFFFFWSGLVSGNGEYVMESHSMFHE